MKSLTKSLSLLLLALPLLAYASADKATVADLLKDGAKYDKKAVVVIGKVDKFAAKTSRSGKDYFVFKLHEGDKFVSIYGQGKLDKAPKDGDMVEVTGEFGATRTVGTQTFKNEIDVSHRLKSTYGVKIFKK